MKENPFTSETFVNTWLTHFNEGKAGIAFPFIRNLLFVKHRVLKLYINIGKTQTKGLSYEISEKPTHKKLGRGVYLIYDVPEFWTDNKSFSYELGRYIVQQYPGYLIKLQAHKDMASYMTSTFKSKSRYKLRSYKKKLERTFQIIYKMYFGEISKEEYDQIFDAFKFLLEKRFKQKGESNNNLEAKEWLFYKDVVYTLILEKKACLYVIYANDIPIGISLNYISENTLHLALTTFDIDYFKYNVGTVMTMNLIEWCFSNNIKIFDFSKGHYDYKTRWGSMKYNFEYHILYNKSSLHSRFLALSFRYFFALKQVMRELGINNLLHKVTFIARR